MIRYISRRVVQAVATVFIVATVAFVLGRASGSPAALLLTDGATDEQIAELDAALGFDRPVWQQYGDFLSGLVRGDLGTSYRDASASALDTVFQRLPATASLALTAFAVGLIVAVLAAVAIHLTGSSRLRSAFIWGGSLRQSMPDFFFGVVTVLFFSVLLGWLPSLGNQGPASYVLPVITIATGQFVLYVRLLDSAMSEQANQDYVRTARARGKKHWAVVITDMLPNAFLPVLTVAGLNLAGLLGGTVIVEQVFSWPGLGQVLIEAVSQRDFPIVQAGLLVVAVVFVTANLLVDILYSVIDPRVRMR